MTKLSSSILLFLAVSSGVTLVASHSTANISVNESGSDSKPCLVARTTPCQTLVYVVQNLKAVIHSGNDLKKNIFIEVYSNQTIDSPPVQVHIESSSISVTVSGVGSPFLLCSSNSSIAITAKSPYNWKWEGLTFHGCGGSLQVNNSIVSYPGLSHSNGSTIIIQKCSLSMHTQVQIDYTMRASVRNCNFTQHVPFQCVPLVHSDCSNITHDGFHHTTFNFTGNAIANYICNGLSTDFQAFVYSPKCYSQVTIDSNLFMDLTFDTPSPIDGIISLYNRHVKGTIYSAASVKFSNNIFSNISTDFSIVTVSYSVYTCIAEHNKFTSISNQTDKINRMVLFMQLCDSVHLLHNQFKNIENFLLISTSWSSSKSYVTVDDLVLANNTIGKSNKFHTLISLIASNISVHNVHATSNCAFAKIFAVISTDDYLLKLNGTEQLTVSNVTFIDNHFPLTKSSALVLVNGPHVLISDVLFRKNIGTPLKVFQECDGSQQSLVLSGTLLFKANAGTLGGALSLGICGSLIFHEDVHMIGKNNVAQYGGFMYVNHTTDVGCKNVSFLLEDNIATSAGDLLYLVTPTVPFNCSLSQNNNDEFNSVATNLSFLSDEMSLSIFPGQGIFIDVSITDYFGHPSSCVADVFLQCDDGNAVCSTENINLEGPGSAIISQTANTHNINLNTRHAVSSRQNINKSVAIEFTCITIDQLHPLSLVIPLNVIKCPLGFVYNPSHRVCECVNYENISTNFICSAEFGAACVAHGYWYGRIRNDDSNTTVHTIANCRFPQCSYSYEPCPKQLQPRGNTANFALLHSDSDDQCSPGRGGVLCRNCREEFELTFTAVNCVPHSDCRQWQPYIIILISLVFQILFAIFLLSVVRFKISLGSGFLYGPMLFLSVIGNLPLSHYSEYSALDTLVSVLSSIPLLNFEVFGLIPWCFFYPFDQVYNYSLRYLGPLTVLVVILIAVFLAHYCSRAFRRLQSSPLRAMCLLMILSFWSLADTSIKILTPELISDSLWVSVQPDMRYFSPRHLPVAIPALLVLLVLITPLLLLLLFFPLLSKVINLHRIKPFLDEFHSCYKDSFRWYSAVYFISWIIVVIFQPLPFQLEIRQTIFALLLTGQIIFQPYQTKLLNTADGLLLVDINFLIGLAQSDLAASTVKVVLVHCLVIGPLLCIGVWFVYVCINKLRKHQCFKKLCTHQCFKKLSRRKASEEELHETVSVLPPEQTGPVKLSELILVKEHSWSEREPLIRIVDYQINS